MLDVDPLLLEAITGSHQVASRARGWYAGQPSYTADLPVVAWEVTADGRSPVERTGSLTVATDDETLDPDSVTHALAAYGSEIELHAGVRLPGREPVLAPLGMFRVTRSTPESSRRTYRVRNGAVTQVATAFGGVQIDVTFKDRAILMDRWRFTAPTQSPAGATVYGELIRLMNPIGLVGPHEVPDKILTATLSYETNDRLTAFDQLARYAGARLIWNPVGQAILVPRDEPRGHWIIPAGDEGIIVSTSTTIDGDAFANGAFSSGRTDEGAEVVGWKLEEQGPLRWGGPAGCAPYFHDSPLIATTPAAFADAATTYESAVRRRMQVVTIECVSNPALETFDSVSWQMPGKGTFTGQAQRITWRHTGFMTLEVLVPLDAWMELR